MRQQFGHCRLLRLDTGQCPMMADPQLPMAPGTQDTFRPLYLLQPPGSNGNAVFNSRGQTGRTGLIPDRQLPFPCLAADVRLGPAAFHKGRNHVRQSRNSPHTGTVIPAVIEIGAYRNIGIPFCRSPGQHRRETALFAVIAAFCIIGHKFRHRKVMCRQNLMPDASQRRNGFGIREFLSRQQLRGGGDSHRPLSQCQHGRPGQHRAVHATRQCYCQAGIRPQLLQQCFCFFHIILPTGG